MMLILSEISTKLIHFHAKIMEIQSSVSILRTNFNGKVSLSRFPALKIKENPSLSRFLLWKVKEKDPLSYYFEVKM